MIPKTIHYCWFGKSKKPESVINCINSWKKFCPEYEIIEWNEKNTDFSNCQYAVDAYQNKKWAFVSDYVRIKVIVDYGGLYCDTDVEIIRNLDDLLDQEAFIGFERNYDGKYGVNTGSMMGAIPGSSFFLLQEQEYRTVYKFGEKMPNGRMKTCVDYTTELLLRYGLHLDNKVQSVLGVTIYPCDFFSPRDMWSGVIKITSRSRSIHRYDGTWADETENYGYHLKWECLDRYGLLIGRYVYFYKYAMYIISHEGLKEFLNRCLRKVRHKNDYNVS